MKANSQTVEIINPEFLDNLANKFLSGKTQTELRNNLAFIAHAYLVMCRNPQLSPEWIVGDFMLGLLLNETSVLVFGVAGKHDIFWKPLKDEFELKGYSSIRRA